MLKSKVKNQDSVPSRLQHLMIVVRRPIRSIHLIKNNFTVSSYGRTVTNFRSILPRFRDIAAFVPWTPTFSYPTHIHRKFGQWACSLWSSNSIDVIGAVRVKTLACVLFSNQNYMTTVPESHRQTDRLTDRQATCQLSRQYRALISIAR